MDYVPDRRGMAALLRNSDDLRRALVAVAERGADYLRGIAPVEEGEYREHISVEVGTDLLKGDRQAAFIVVNVPHAAAQDFPHGRGGQRRRGGSRPLARTLGFIEGGG